MSTFVALPDPGQIVEVRQRQWVVQEIHQSSLPSEALSSHGPLQNFVSLSSIEDDALGEELQVLWEIEPGVKIREHTALPSPRAGFDHPARLDTFLDAVRWGAVSSANIRMLQAPFRSGVTIEDYQLDPVVRALSMPRVNLLIADDVGLGKTIEAGLVAQELLLRHRARTILIICPSSIQIQWREQMRDKFGLAFRIVDSALMKQLRRQRGLHVNPWNHFPRLIASIDFLKRERPMQLFREILPPEGDAAFPRRFDLLIVDEAHNVAPPGIGRYATDSLRTLAIRTLVPHFEHKLFLTATPHNGYPESFSALLELLDNQRFTRRIRPEPEQLEKVMVRRLKSELPPRWDGSPRFPLRELFPLEIDLPAHEQQAYRTLQAYAASRQQGSESRAEEEATQFVLKLLKKRLLSSPEAFRTTLEQHRLTLNKEHASTREVAKPLPGILRARLDTLEEEFSDDDEYEAASVELVDATTRLFRKPDAHELAFLDELQHYAQQSSGKPDAKAHVLIDWLEHYIRPNGAWNNRRVLIFTEYRTTQNWLYGLLATRGFAKENRLMMLYGGMESAKREVIKAAFQADPAESEVRILLATDAASEGLDLQNHCADLIHYEIPWNPNRLEQRNGRIDRHGQKSNQVRIYHFVTAGYEKRVQQQRHSQPGNLEGDLEFLMRAAIKVNTIREDLGSVGPVLARQVEEAMLGRRHDLNTHRAEARARTIRQRLTFERNLRQQLESLLEQLKQTRQELRLEPANIQQAVTVALGLAGQPPLQEAHVPGIWPDSTGKHALCPVFTLPPLRGSWSRCAEGLAHPHTKKIRPIVFNHDPAQGRDDVVLVHLNHRLVRMALHLLRAEIWSSEDRRKLHRVYRAPRLSGPGSISLRLSFQRFAGDAQSGARCGFGHAAGSGATRLLDGELEAVSLQRTIARCIYGEVRSGPDLGEKSCLL
jgi:SNF2 family DNA or RNA helicase